jgi:hypothetical protein
MFRRCFLSEMNIDFDGFRCEETVGYPFRQLFAAKMSRQLVFRTKPRVPGSPVSSPSLLYLNISIFQWWQKFTGASTNHRPLINWNFPSVHHGALYEHVRTRRMMLARL